MTGAYPFRVLRDADIEIQSDEAGDLLESIEKGLRQRRFGSVVNLTIQTGTPKQVRELLRANLEMRPEDVWEVDAPLGLSDVAELTDLDRPDLKNPPLIPRPLPELRRGQDPFAAIRRGDLLLHHPYDAFSTVTDFIQAAAHDPQVLAIKQTLYRVGAELADRPGAAGGRQRGKQVAVLVELKARFDEENNIEWARMLERAGVHVVYGQVGLKTHAKVALVVRRESERPAPLRPPRHRQLQRLDGARLRRFRVAHLPYRHRRGCHRSLQRADRLRAWHHATVSCWSRRAAMRAGLLARIQREITRTKENGSGRLIFKINSLVDPAHDPGALSRLAGRCRDRPDRARHVFAAARHSRRQREYSRGEPGRAHSWSTAASTISPMAARTRKRC